MSNAAQILNALDHHLDTRVELTLYGRAALQLGYPNPAPEFAESSWKLCWGVPVFPISLRFMKNFSDLPGHCPERSNKGIEHQPMPGLGADNQNSPPRQITIDFVATRSYIIWYAGCRCERTEKPSEPLS